MTISISEQRVEDFRRRPTPRYIERIICYCWLNTEECECMSCKHLDKMYRHYCLTNRDNWTGKEDNAFRGII